MLKTYNKMSNFLCLSVLSACLHFQFLLLFSDQEITILRLPVFKMCILFKRPCPQVVIAYVSLLFRTALYPSKAQYLLNVFCKVCG